MLAGNFILRLKVEVGAAVGVTAPPAFKPAHWRNGGKEPAIIIWDDANLDLASMEFCGALLAIPDKNAARCQSRDWQKAFLGRLLTSDL